MNTRLLKTGHKILFIAFVLRLLVGVYKNLGRTGMLFADNLLSSLWNCREDSTASIEIGSHLESVMRVPTVGFGALIPPQESSLGSRRT